MKKKIVSIVLCIMFVLSMGIIGVSANNYTDTAYSFNFVNEYAPATNARAKLDDSYSYMKCNSTAYTYTASVYARTSEFANEFIDVSHGNVYQFSTGIYHKMTNFVKEDGNYSWAGIIGFNPDGPCVASGVWSPDYT